MRVRECIQNLQITPPKDDRDDTVFCSSTQCNQTQIASGYHAISAEGLVPNAANSPEPIVPLYFWWNPTLEKNWVTNSSTAPGPGYGPGHGGDGYLYANPSGNRWSAETFYCSKDPNYIVAVRHKETRNKVWIRNALTPPHSPRPHPKVKRMQLLKAAYHKVCWVMWIHRQPSLPV